MEIFPAIRWNRSSIGHREVDGATSDQSLLTNHRLLMANKKRICYLPSVMSTRSCRVTIRDIEGVEHTVCVTASSLYEAVALGLAALHGQEWVAGVSTGLDAVKVSVVDVPVEHSVKLKDFTQWLERPGGSPRDVAQRHRVREVLRLNEDRDPYERLHRHDHDRH